VLTVDEVPLSQSALLVVDAQESFKVDAARWKRRSNPHFERNVGALVEAHRAAGLPVIFVLHSDDDDGFSTDSPYYRLMDFLSPEAGEPVVHKDTRNAFTSTNLQSILLHRNVRRVAITGIQMEQCCETTARVAADLGYAVDFVIDGTMTFPIPNPDVAGEELGVAAIEERTTYALRRRFARIARTAELVAALRALTPALAVA
jgi:nicotinamidase-related amidase